MSRSSRRPLRCAAALGGLLLSAGIPLTATPSFAEQGPAQASTTGSCDTAGLSHSDEGGSTASFNTPRNGQPIAASADATTQTARIYGIADLRGAQEGTDEACRATASFDNVLHVGAGTSGLDEGDEVTLVATVAFDPFLDEYSHEAQKQITSWQVTGGYTVVDPQAPCIPDEESGDWCEPAGPLARYVGYAQRTTWADHGQPDSQNPYADPDGYWDYTHDWDWEVTSNTGQDMGDYGSVHQDVCDVFPCTILADPSVPLPLDPAEFEPVGPQQLVFRTSVGATLEVGGAVSLLVQAHDGDVAAVVDASEGLTADIEPAAEYAGLQLTLGDAPPPPPLDTTAPEVTATPSAAANAAGWHAQPVTVDLAATDTGGSGVEAITYRVDDGAPATVAGAQVPVLVDEDGTTTIHYSATDVAGNEAAEQSIVVRLDRGAPVLQVPSGVTAVATGPQGAAVTYAQTASDALSGATSSCTPAAGSTFPVGVTTVTCTAADGAGNTASASFPVTVTAQPLSVGQRIDALQAAVAALKAPASVRSTLDAKLGQAERFVAQGKKPQACTHVAQFVSHVQKSSGRGISPADAAKLVADARAISTALGC